jgi:hypothetical protein
LETDGKEIKRVLVGNRIEDNAFALDGEITAAELAECTQPN